MIELRRYKKIFMVKTKLKINQVLAVTPLSEVGTISLTQTLSEQGVQHVMVEGREALSGDWLHDVVKTGEVSWRPVHLLLMCSLSCVTAALSKVRQYLEE